MNLSSVNKLLLDTVCRISKIRKYDHILSLPFLTLHWYVVKMAMLDLDSNHALCDNIGCIAYCGVYISWIVNAYLEVFLVLQGIKENSDWNANELILTWGGWNL